VDGAKQIKLHGEVVPVLAHVTKVDSMSAHADAGEIMRWLSGFAHPPSMTYLVHGEPAGLEALRSSIVTKLGWPVHVAEYLERVQLP
jgi:metallo-beta-lactamase family protein